MSFNITIPKKEALLALLLILIGCALIAGAALGMFGVYFGVLLAVLGGLYAYGAYKKQRKMSPK
ncbi:MAG: hypothetical protein ACRDF4_03880 [Rhabdochlamydiaceae bacterium]